MNTRTRKQREIEEREKRILEVARPMLLQQGYNGFSMEDIAKELQYSKGTIYNAFSCKEEIILALALETMDIRVNLFRRATEFRGVPRERLCAIGTAAELFVSLHPEHFAVEQLIRCVSIWEKTSEARRTVLRTCESTCVGIVADVIREGIAQGHLTLPPQVSPEDMVFGLWSLHFGTFSIMTTSNSLDEIGIQDPLKALKVNIHMMLDGFGWIPLSSHHDYDAVVQRTLMEVFPDEFQIVSKT